MICAQRDPRNLDASERMTPRDVNVRHQWLTGAAPDLFSTFVGPESGTVVGAVVMCPSLGREYTATYRGMYAMARNLAANGVGALLIDFPGQGDSPSPTDGAVTVGDWIAGVGKGVEALRKVGITKVGLLGLRAGALIAAQAALAIDGIASLTYWDPVDNGRAYIREQSLHARMQGYPASGIWGQRLSDTEIEEFACLELPVVTNPDVSLIVGMRSELLAASRRIRGYAESADALIALNKQQAFVTPDSFSSEMPHQAIGELTNAIRETFGTDTFRSKPPHGTTSAMFGHGNEMVTEKIEEFGSQGLFAISTAHANAPPPRAAALIAPAALEPHTGPGAIWTNLARDLAIDGIDAVRFDRRGLGLSGDPAIDTGNVYSRQSKADILSAARELKTRYELVVGVGACSGAWHETYAARHGVVDGLALANFTFWPTRLLVPLGTNTISNDPVALRVGHYKNLYRSRVPRWLARPLAYTGVMQSPRPMIRVLSKKRIPTSIVMVDEDLSWFRDRETVLGPEDSDCVQVVGLGPGDHGLYWAEAQTSMQRALRVAVGDVADVLTGRRIPR